MVPPARLELATNWFEASYSNPLSYGGVLPDYTMPDPSWLQSCLGMKNMRLEKSYNIKYNFVNPRHETHSCSSCMFIPVYS